MGLTLVFSELQVLLCHLWEKEGKKEKGNEGKRNRKGKVRRMEEGIKKIGGKIRRRNFNKN